MSPRGLFLLVLFALTLIGGGSHAPRADAADLNVLVVDDPADDAEAGAPEITQVTVAHNEAGNVVGVRVWVAGGTDLAADRGIAVSFDQDLDGGTGCIPPITIRAARQVGNILKYVGPEDPVEPRYANYM